VPVAVEIPVASWPRRGAPRPQQHMTNNFKVIKTSRGKVFE